MSSKSCQNTAARDELTTTGGDRFFSIPLREKKGADSTDIEQDFLPEQKSRCRVRLLCRTSISLAQSGAIFLQCPHLSAQDFGQPDALYLVPHFYASRKLIISVVCIDRCRLLHNNHPPSCRPCPFLQPISQRISVLASLYGLSGGGEGSRWCYWGVRR